MSINTTRQENRLKATKAKIEKVKNELKHQRTLKTQTENAKAEADALRLAIPVLRENRSKEIKELEEVIATFPDGDPEKKKLLDDLCNLLKPLADEDTLAAMDAKGYDTTIIDLNISDLELTLEELLRTTRPKPSPARNGPTPGSYPPTSVAVPATGTRTPRAGPRTRPRR
jgi:hypothetical protein